MRAYTVKKSPKIPYTVKKCPANSLHSEKCPANIPLHSGKMSRKFLTQWENVPKIPYTVEKLQEYPYTVSFRTPLFH